MASNVAKVEARSDYWTNYNDGGFPTLSEHEFSGMTVFVVGKTWAKDADPTVAPPVSVTATSDRRMVNRHDWCSCPSPNPHDNEVFYADLVTGSHGWACGNCRKITQTG